MYDFIVMTTAKMHIATEFKKLLSLQQRCSRFVANTNLFRLLLQNVYLKQVIIAHLPINI